MIIKVSTEELTLLYSKAKDMYYDCINDQENAFLHSEINVPLKSILLVEKHIKFTFLPGSGDVYFLDTCLSLYADSKIIGEYVYIVDGLGEIVDDKLVFY